MSKHFKDDYACTLLTDDRSYRDYKYDELKSELKIQYNNMTKAERDFYRSKSLISELEYLIRLTDDETSLRDD